MNATILIYLQPIVLTVSGTNLMTTEKHQAALQEIDKMLQLIGKNLQDFLPNLCVQPINSMDITEESVCSIWNNSLLANLIRQTDLII